MRLYRKYLFAYMRAGLALYLFALILAGCAGLDAALVRHDLDHWNSTDAEAEAFVAVACAGHKPDEPYVTPTGFKTTFGEFYKSRAAWAWTRHRVLKRACQDTKIDAAALRAPSLREEGIPVLEPASLPGRERPPGSSSAAPPAAPTTEAR